jgi:hypothetical protein
MQDLKPETASRIILGVREMNAGAEIYTEGQDDETVGEAPDLDEAELGTKRHGEHEHDPTYLELQSVIDSLTAEEQCDLIALAWLGRGDGTREDWNDLVALARDRRSNHTGDYLLAMPLLAEYLADGLEGFGFSGEDVDDESR